jgi:Domain of unknown function (DUF4411)
MTIYVFDNSPFSTLFRNFYPKRFPSLWARFDEMIEDGRITSTREVLRELEDNAPTGCLGWAKAHKDVFTNPTAAEGAFVGSIYAVPHFQQNIERKKLYKGGKNADPFVITKASVDASVVVTLENHPPNAAKIPNICDHFDVKCMNLEEFMEAENWSF